MRKPWFKPKIIGFGAGLPCSWEGWLLLAAFVGVVVGGVYFSRQFEAPLLRFGIQIGVIVIAGAIFLPIMAARTEGGWRWRPERND